MGPSFVKFDLSIHFISNTSLVLDLYPSGKSVSVLPVLFPQTPDSLLEAAESVALDVAVIATSGNFHIDVSAFAARNVYGVAGVESASAFGLVVFAVYVGAVLELDAAVLADVAIVGVTDSVRAESAV